MEQDMKADREKEGDVILLVNNMIDTVYYMP